MPRHAVGEHLVCNVSFRLPMSDHALLLAYAEAKGVAWQAALREIVHQSLRGEPTDARSGQRVREQTQG
jgi:hypothetical protein